MRRRGGILSKLFKISIIFCHWLSEIYKKKRKMRFYACCFKNIKCASLSLIMLRYETDYVTVHSVTLSIKVNRMQVMLFDYYTGVKMEQLNFWVDIMYSIVEFKMMVLEELVIVLSPNRRTFVTTASLDSQKGQSFVCVGRTVE